MTKFKVTVVLEQQAVMELEQDDPSSNLEFWQCNAVDEKEFSTNEEAEKMFQKLKQSLSGL